MMPYYTFFTLININVKRIIDGNAFYFNSNRLNSIIFAILSIIIIV